MFEKDKKTGVVINTSDFEAYQRNKAAVKTLKVAKTTVKESHNEVAHLRFRVEKLEAQMQELLRKFN